LNGRIDLMNWQEEFESIGAYWKHDGNPKRPYALLTSGKISDFFFNGSKVIERPKLVEEIAFTLMRLYRKRSIDTPQVVVGPAIGAISLIHEIAKQLPSKPRAWFTEEILEAGEKKVAFKRFDNSDNVRRALLVEDVITTGKSTMGTVEALGRLTPTVDTLPYALCIINRSGKETLPNGARIIALLTIEARTWDRGGNHFTPDGQELVEPVRPKANWAALTQEY
jgi:orotate phosphoribosyltransferase